DGEDAGGARCGCRRVGVGWWTDAASIAGGRRRRAGCAMVVAIGEVTLVGACIVDGAMGLRLGTLPSLFSVILSPSPEISLPRLRKEGRGREEKWPEDLTR
ncbi:hypothetical protein U1Q18_003443, partial [Sarracenia purpurea var. burkii]